LDSKQLQVEQYADVLYPWSLSMKAMGHGLERDNDVEI
jgi:hypothetical protein